MKKIMTIIGARPQFIKASVLSKAFLDNSDKFKEVLIHTGQHYDDNMSQVFFDQMNIPKPHYKLNINHRSHGAMTGEMMISLDRILIDELPDAVLVYGDTNSTLAGALSAVKLHIPVIHVEAGLRSFNRNMPEEINRMITDQHSHLLFCPSDTAITNLKNEGIEHNKGQYKVVKTGDIMLEAMNLFSPLAKGRFDLEKKTNDSFHLLTLHRAENTDDTDKITEIFDALNALAEDGNRFIFPVHPRTKNVLSELGFYIHHNILQVQPVGYVEMLYLLNHANCLGVLTDSGGVQKEAYFASKPCLTLREQTEWVELIENNVNFLVGSKKEKILKSFKQLNQIKNFPPNLYGEGKESEKMLEYIDQV